uniref:Helicase ATP-binding domain-containing protein n=2 Tax=Capitella teleta TaxID=283909 RepID=X2A0K9_CAPTE
PLKALIADQVKVFRDQGLSCVGLLPKEDGDLEGFCQGKYNLVISSPEALLDDGELGMKYEHCLKKLNICLITYDEAHVIRECKELQLPLEGSPKRKVTPSPKVTVGQSQKLPFHIARRLKGKKRHAQKDFNPGKRTHQTHPTPPVALVDDVDHIVTKHDNFYVMQQELNTFDGSQK